MAFESWIITRLVRIERTQSGSNEMMNKKHHTRGWIVDEIGFSSLLLVLLLIFFFVCVPNSMLLSRWVYFVTSTWHILNTLLISTCAQTTDKIAFKQVLGSYSSSPIPFVKSIVKIESKLFFLIGDILDDLIFRAAATNRCDSILIIIIFFEHLKRM